MANLNLAESEFTADLGVDLDFLSEFHIRALNLLFVSFKKLY